MTDRELTEAWLACTLGRGITHEEHVRISYVVFRTHGREDGVHLTQHATRANSAALGAAERYDPELTQRWAEAIADAVEESHAETADEFLGEHPHLLDSSLFGPPRWKVEPEHAGLVRRLFGAFERKDAFALRSFFAEDAVWRIGGASRLAGTYRGRREIVRFLGSLPRLTDGTYASRLTDVLAGEGRAAVLYRATGEREGRTLDIDQLLLFTIADGLVTEVLALPSDQAAFDAFWGP